MADEELAVFGLSRSDIPDEEIEVYPDNWEAFITFDAMSTQWRTGALGVTGLDYNCIPVVLKGLGVKKSKLYQIMPKLRVMEAEAMKVMQEQRK